MDGCIDGAWMQGFMYACLVDMCIARVVAWMKYTGYMFFYDFLCPFTDLVLNRNISFVIL